MRKSPSEGLKKAISHVRSIGGKVIVELGSMRQPCGHPDPLDCPPDCPGVNEGHSTLAFARTGLQVYTVDIARGAYRIANAMSAEYPNLHAFCMDGLTWLRKRSGKIDLLYLDAWDVDLPDSADRHYEAYEIGRRKLSPGGMIIVDDIDVEYDGEKFVPSYGIGGKAGKIAVSAVVDGYTVSDNGRHLFLEAP